MSSPSPAAAPDSAPPPKTKSSIARFAPLAVILTALIVGLVFLRDAVSIETLQDNRAQLTAWRDAHYALAAAAYVTAYALVVALSLPFALPMTLTGGFLFGLAAGSLLTITAATIGAVGVFLAARYAVGDVLRARTGPWLKKVEAGLRRNEISYLFLLRLVPAVPFFAANLAPAFLGVKLRTFVWTTFFGIAPGTVAFTFAGAGIGDVFDRGEEFSFSLFADPMIYGPILGLIAVATLPIVINAVRGKSDHD